MTATKPLLYALLRWISLVLPNMAYARKSAGDVDPHRLWRLFDDRFNQSGSNIRSYWNNKRGFHRIAIELVL